MSAHRRYLVSTCGAGPGRLAFTDAAAYGHKAARRPVAAVAAPEEYLSIAQLMTRIPLKLQSIYNAIHRGTFVLGIHYLKPGGNGHPVFKWSAVKAWLEQGAP